MMEDMCALCGPDLIVLRRHPDLPESFRTGDLDGKWFDKGALIRVASSDLQCVATPTGRFEFRDDCVCAEVYEIRP